MHIRAALTQTQLSIPVENGRMLLGTWQGIYLFEHRSAGTGGRLCCVHWGNEEVRAVMRGLDPRIQASSRGCS